jgi:hypothetical protein
MMLAQNNSILGKIMTCFTGKEEASSSKPHVLRPDRATMNVKSRRNRVGDILVGS